MKERLLEAATEMFATRPRESVTIRAVAAAAGASTAAVYTLFDSKDVLINEVRNRAVAGLSRDLSAVPVTDDPLADLYALAVAYRRWGREHSHLYTVLFGGVQRFDPSGEMSAGDPVRPLVDTIGRALSASVLVGEVTPIALSLWVTLHGLVALELAGALDATTAEAIFPSTILATLRGWATPSQIDVPGSSPGPAP
ncbi:DNA-binding transcriptional regulator, AcrR family [Nonomuraea jiangxiensis]|uniref:DNA-binding transcriptional regulator, AcrR family n=1 Tax=Nonomuraea jiangxiensis TaxID=633440 RepID=A0A1G8TL17_9ACTN|nr:DNA-binding transcriptional regulator, AcrR family [Nonomuraea jiangxiensis]